MEYENTSRPGTIAVLVVDEIGQGKPKVSQPVANAVVELHRTNPKEGPKEAMQIKQTGENGRTEFGGLQPGHYWLECHAFKTEPLCMEVDVSSGCIADLRFCVDLQFQLRSRVAAADCEPPKDCDQVTEGRVVKLEAEFNRSGIRPADITWYANAGRIELDPKEHTKAHLFTEGAVGTIEVKARFSDPKGAKVSAAKFISVSPQVAQLVKGTVAISGNVGVTKKRTEVPPTDDLGFWSAIRNHSKAISFGGIGGGNRVGYQGFIDAVLCGRDIRSITDVRAEDCDPVPSLENLMQLSSRMTLNGMSAYELLKTATEIFLLWNCGVVIRDTDAVSNAIISDQEELSRIGLDTDAMRNLLVSYLGPGRLPYIQRVIDVAFPSEPLIDSVFCAGLLRRNVNCVCLIELIWSYWHEEGMLVQTLNSVSRRFQNMRGPGDRDPLAHLEVDPLRPLNNIFWGYVQDEQNLLSVKRRAYEYSHHYGLELYGKAIPTMRTADNRSKFLQAFHNLLHAAATFYKEDNDTNYIAEGYPLLNALKEVHLILAQGAHNQFGDLPWTARVEMLTQQWLMARPEMRDFLQSRPMVPYTEAWMPQVDSMKTLQGWSDVTITHFHDLGAYGEQLLLSVRYGNWIALNDENNAKNWARYWRPEIQGYLHAYRAVTGVDLANNEAVDFTLPGIHLQKRLATQRVR
jgi:hypothetical protein